MMTKLDYSQWGIYRLFSGAVIGLGVTILLFAMFVEHFSLLIYLIYLPFIGSILGCLLSYKGIIRSFSLLSLLGIFVILIVFSYTANLVRSVVTENQRRTTAMHIVPVYPNSNLINTIYNKGDGFDIEPKIKQTFSTEDLFPSVMSYYTFQLIEWRIIGSLDEQGGLWAKDGLGIGIFKEKGASNDSLTKYSVSLIYWN